MIVWMGLIGFIIVAKLAMGRLYTKKAQKRYLILVGFVTVIILSLRGENYGSVYDVRVYMNFFESVAVTEWNKIPMIQDFEVGFVILNKLLSYISHSGRTIILFEACFCIYSVSRFIYKNSNEVFWAYFFFMTLGNFGFMVTGIRQSIAICVTLFAVEYAKERKLIPFLIVNTVAISIHTSAWVFLITYFLIGNKLIEKHKELIIVLISGMVIGAPQIIEVGKMISDEVKAGSEAVYSLNGIVPILIYSIAILGHIFLMCRNENDRKSVGLEMTAMGLGLYFLRFYNMALERLAFYHLQGSTVALADLMGKIKRNQEGRVIQMFVVLICLFLFYHRLSTASYANYIFLWSE